MLNRADQQALEPTDAARDFLGNTTARCGFFRLRMSPLFISWETDEAVRVFPRETIPEGAMRGDGWGQS